MKKKIKRLFSIVLAAIMIVSVSTVNAKAASYPAVFFMGDESFEEVTVTQTAYVGDVVPIRMEWFCEYNNEGYELNIYDTISWNAVDGAVKYWIYRSTDGTNFKYYDTTTKTSYTNSSVTSGTKYYYKVNAVNSADGTSTYSAVKSTIPLTTPTLSATLSSGKIKLSWGSVTGATKYWIYRSTDGINFSYYDSTTNTSYTNSSVTAGTTYYYKIRAVKTVNSTDWTGSYSNVVSKTR